MALFFPATIAIDFKPPMVTIATKTVRIAAVYMTGIPMERLVISTIALTCVKVPLPKQATITPNTENITARGLYFLPSPCSI